MPVQAYNINTRDNIEGNLDGLSYTNSIRESFKAKNVVNYGTAVDRVPADGDRVVQTGQALEGHTFGVAIRQVTTESDFRPNTGASAYPVGAIVPILEDGFIWVVSAGAAAVGDAVYVHSTTGRFTNAVTAGYVKSSNMVFESSCAAGGLAKVFISRAIINAAPIVASSEAEPKAKK
jgi:hypothetical protein